jgi:hypothetical protein
LPLGLDFVACEGMPYRGRRLDVFHEARAGREGAAHGRGLTVRVDGEIVLRDEEFVPGRSVVEIPDRP